MHRVGQFVSHVRARVGPDEESDARSILGDPLWRLFVDMPVADRRHALDVVKELRRGGHDDRDLLSAALLHDVAKGDRMRLWHRVVGVLGEAVSPRLVARLASDDPGSWRYPFHLYLHHGRLSAEIVERSGGSARTVDLMRGTPTTPADARLARALEAADDAS